MANPTTNLGMTKPTVGGSTDTWGTTINENVVDIIDALFSVSGTDVTMSDIKFNSMSVQETGAGTDIVKIQAPAAVTTSYTLTMPAAVGSTNQVLSAADGSGTLAWTTPEVGDITSVVAGAGMTGGGSSGAVTLNVIGTADKITVSADAVTIASTYVGQTSITTVGALAAGSIASGFTSISTSLTDAKVESVVAGNLIDVSGATGDVTVSADLSELSTSTSDGDGDYFAVVDAANAQKKLTKANISIAGFNTAVATSVTGTGVVASGTWQGTAVANAYVSDALTISGGSVDNSIIGASTAAAGTFTQVDVEAQGDLRLQDTTGGQYVAFQAAGTTTSYTLTMPAAVPSANEVLTASDGSGTLSWAAPTVGDITGVTAGTGLSGGGTTGTVTLNVEAAQTQITSVGALNAGSITSGFGAIDVGSSAIDGGTITGTFSGNITGNVIGNASGTAATVTGAAQTAITSVGTLTSLTTSGAVTLAATQKVVFDSGTDHTYIDEYEDNKLGFTTNGVRQLSLAVDECIISQFATFNGAIGVAGNVSLATTKKVIFDSATNHTYIDEYEDNKLGFTTNGVRQLILAVDECTISQYATFNAAVKMASLPTSDPGTAGALWNSSGDMKISAG
jgi:hypothetical protein